MSEMIRRAGLGRRMLPVYREVDDVLKTLPRVEEVKCKEGCSACCSLLAGMTLPEAVLIAEYIESHPEAFPNRLAVYEEASRQADILAQMADARTLDATTWWGRQIPCALLDPVTKTCRVYPVRPIVCRTHLVITDPARCAMQADTKVASLDTARLDAWATAHTVSTAQRFEVPVMAAPIAVMLAHGFLWLAEGRAPSDEEANAWMIALMPEMLRLANEGRGR